MIPQLHSEASARKYGGKPEDYEDIHRLLDSTKACYGNNNHRMFTHNSWFVCTIIPMIFGEMRINSDGKRYSTKDVAEEHVLADFKGRFIPTIQDYLEHMPQVDWINNGGGVPNRLKSKKLPRIISFDEQAELTPEQLEYIEKFHRKIK